MGCTKLIQIVCSIVAVGLWMIPLMELHKLGKVFKEKDTEMNKVIRKCENKYKLMIVCIIFGSLFSIVSIVIGSF